MQVNTLPMLLCAVRHPLSSVGREMRTSVMVFWHAVYSFCDWDMCCAGAVDFP